jgi:hypothetical protein
MYAHRKAGVSRLFQTLLVPVVGGVLLECRRREKIPVGPVVIFDRLFVP